MWGKRHACECSVLRDLERAPEPLALECGYWELNSVPVDEQTVPFTTAIFPAPGKSALKVTKINCMNSHFQNRGC